MTATAEEPAPGDARLRDLTVDPAVLSPAQVQGLKESMAAVGRVYLRLAQAMRPAMERTLQIVRQARAVMEAAEAAEAELRHARQSAYRSDYRRRLQARRRRRRRHR